MNKEKVQLILGLIDLSLKYGVPVVKKIMEDTDKKKITKKDIDNLLIDKNWEGYFE